MSIGTSASLQEADRQNRLSKYEILSILQKSFGSARQPAHKTSISKSMTLTKDSQTILVRIQSVRKPSVCSSAGLFHCHSKFAFPLAVAQLEQMLLIHW